jgi:abortive infection bacteriophage resistance protein
MMARELDELRAGFMPYDLEHKSPNELIDLLESRNLSIDISRAEAERCIETVGYFHLKGYLALLKESGGRVRY